MQHLQELDIGLDVGVAKVPLVPAAILFDLAIDDCAVTPIAEMGKAAATNATNTTIAAVARNGMFTLAEMTKIAQMAHNGLVRMIYPVHTIYDGDTIFAVTTGGIEVSVDLVGMWVAEVLAYAVYKAIIAAQSVERCALTQD